VSKNIRNLWELTGHSIELYFSIGKQRSGTLAKSFDQNVKFIGFYLSMRLQKAVGKYFDDDLQQVQFTINNSTCFAKFLPHAMRSRLLLSYYPTIALKNTCGPVW